MTLFRQTLTTPLGDMIALDSGAGLCALTFAEPTAFLPRSDGRLRRWFPAHEIVDRGTPLLERTRAWLERYFAGSDADLDGFPLDLRGGAFETRVWAALVTIPAGATTSYGAIAKAIGAPRASRAVGAANGANPIPILVPCHRVIGSSGSLTGYGGGIDRKAWLLDHERRWRRDPQPSLFG